MDADAANAAKNLGGTQACTQIIAGFLPTLPFQQRFSDLDNLAVAMLGSWSSRPR